VKQQDSVQRSGLQAFQNALDALATLFVLVWLGPPFAQVLKSFPDMCALAAVKGV
jgi:hypothetical protein